MRIAFVTPEYITEKNFDGGLANYLGRVCPALVKDGHNVVVIVASDHDEKNIHQGVEVHHVKTDHPVLRWTNRLTLRLMTETNSWLLQSWLLNRICAKCHEECPFDIIQYASYTATGIFRLRQVPTVVRLSSYEPLLRKAYGQKTSRGLIGKAFIEALAIRRADGVFSPSRLMADVVKERLKIPVQVIESPIAIDVENLEEQPYLEHLHNKSYLLFFGTISLLKGIYSIAEVIEPILKNHPDVHFVFIGKDLGHQGRPLMDYVWEKAGSMRHRAIYLEPMCHEKLYPILAKSIAVVLPSRIDNLPNTCLESMALKKIVIGTKGTSFEEIIDDGYNGFICKADCASSLLKSIETALSLTTEDRLTVGERAYQRVCQLKPEITIPKLIDYYKLFTATAKT